LQFGQIEYDVVVRFRSGFMDIDSQEHSGSGAVVCGHCEIAMQRDPVRFIRLLDSLRNCSAPPTG
jgi:hypothetical protein